MNNYVAPSFAIKRLDRAVLIGHKSCVLWFTGLSASGKSTIANLVEQKLVRLGKHTYILDGDHMRTGLCKDLKFSIEDRQENIRRVSEVAKILYDAGIIVICSFISPFRKERDLARTLFDEGEFIEIYVSTPLDICRRRDYKGLYDKAEAGIIANFTGITSPYEAPVSPEIILNTIENSADESASIIVEYIASRTTL